MFHRNVEVHRGHFPGEVWLILLVLWAVLQGPAEAAVLRIEGATMGTTYSVQIVDRSLELDRERLAEQIEDLLAQLNRSLSTYLPEAEVTRFNQSPTTGWVSISPTLFEVLEEADHWSRKTGGAFDVTVGPLVDLWGFGPPGNPHRIPEDELILRTGERVGYEMLEIRARRPAIRKTRVDLQLDLSAIAKGFAVDRLAAFLARQGIDRSLVEIGGELRAAGQNEQGLPWTVAIERPLPTREIVGPVIRLSGQGVATSGDYRNYFVRDGRRFSHLIDPRSGRPLEGGLVSVTVVAASAAAADALATGLMVMGMYEGERFARRQGIAAFFIVRQGGRFRERWTPQLDPLLTGTE